MSLKDLLTYLLTYLQKQSIFAGEIYSKIRAKQALRSFWSSSDVNRSTSDEDR